MPYATLIQDILQVIERHWAAATGGSGFTGGALVIFLYLRKKGFFKSKNKSQKNTLSPGLAEQCILNGKKLVELETKINDHEKDLDNGMEEFREVQKSIERININIAVITSELKGIKDIKLDIQNMVDELKPMQIELLNNQLSVSQKADNLRIMVDQFSESLKTIKR